MAVFISQKSLHPNADPYLKADNQKPLHRNDDPYLRADNKKSLHPNADPYLRADNPLAIWSPVKSSSSLGWYTVYVHYILHVDF